MGNAPHSNGATSGETPGHNTVKRARRQLLTRAQRVEVGVRRCCLRSSRQSFPRSHLQSNGETDIPLVATLYRDAFTDELGRRTGSTVGKGDRERGIYESRKAQPVSNNRIGDAGVTFIARACGIQGVLPKMKKLYLGFNDTDGLGIAGLADCLSGGALPALEVLEVGRDFVGDLKFSAACKSRSPPIKVG
eukprot:3486792-Prymnesium_polylepis.1